MSRNNIPEVNLIRHFDVDTGWRGWLGAYAADVFKSGVDGDIDSRVKLIPEDGFSFNIRNQLDAPFEGVISKLTSGAGTVAGMAAGAVALGQAFSESEVLQNLIPSGTGSLANRANEIGKINPALRYVKAWSKTDPVNFSLKFSFKMGQFGLWNAREEVVKPIVALILPSLPRTMNGLTMEGPYRSAPQLFGSMIASLLNGGGSGVQGLLDRITSIANASGLTGLGAGTITVQIGNVAHMPRCYLTGVTANLNPNKVDQNGFSIEGDITMSFESVYPPASLSHIATGDSKRSFNSRFGKV